MTTHPRMYAEGRAAAARREALARGLIVVRLLPDDQAEAVPYRLADSLGVAERSASGGAS